MVARLTVRLGVISMWASPCLLFVLIQQIVSCLPTLRDAPKWSQPTPGGAQFILNQSVHFRDNTNTGHCRTTFDHYIVIAQQTHSLPLCTESIHGWKLCFLYVFLLLLLLPPLLLVALQQLASHQSDERQFGKASEFGSIQRNVIVVLGRAGASERAAPRTASAH